jgi:hypothetical protein
MKKEFKAFPWGAQNHIDGMTLRDYFAAKAMEGLLSTVKDEEWHCDETASISYDMADAMMEARK